MGMAPPPLALHIFPGVARLCATSNIKHPSLGAACRSLSEAGFSFLSGERAKKLVFYVDTVYIAKSFLAYSPSLPSFFGLGVGTSTPTFLGTPHITWGVAGLCATSNIKHHSLSACRSGGPARRLVSNVQKGVLLKSVLLRSAEGYQKV